VSSENKFLKNLLVIGACGVVVAVTSEVTNVIINKGENVLTAAHHKELPITKNSKKVKVKKNQIKFLGYTRTYKDTPMPKGQKWIDSNKRTHVATWGDTWKQNCNDRKNTMIVAHNSGAFSPIVNLRVGNKITVTDYKGKTRNYKVKKVLTGNTRGWVGKKCYLGEICSSGERERITLQTCVGRNQRRWVIAE
jgi:hypothetical protein